MGCSISGLNSMYDAANAGGDVWINENRYRIIRKLGEGGFAFVFLVKEILTNTSSDHVGVAKKSNKSSYVSGLILSLPLLSHVFIYVLCRLLSKLVSS